MNKNISLIFISFLVLFVTFFVGCDLDYNTDNGNETEGNSSTDNGNEIKDNSPKINPPQNIRAETGTTGVTLYWSDVSNALSFDIYFGLSSDNLQYLISRTAILSTGTTISYTVSSGSQSLTGGNRYYFAIKSNGTAGVSDFSQIVIAFLPPASSDRRELVSAGSTSDSDISTSSYYHQSISSGGTQWFYISGSAGRTYTIYVANAKVTSSSNPIANVSATFYRQDGTIFTGSLTLDKSEYLYIKVVGNTSGEYRRYYRSN